MSPWRARPCSRAFQPWSARFPEWFIILLLLSGIGPSSASAHVVLRAERGAPLRWASVEIPLRLEGMPSSLLAPAAVERAIAGAAGAWSAVPCAALVLRALAAPSGDPDIAIRFESSTWDPSLEDALAYTVNERNRDGVILSSRIAVNEVSATWTTDPTRAVFSADADLQGVLTHELGHALGLDHPAELEATMFFSFSGPELRSLHDDDARGLCFLYPSEDQVSGPGFACDSCVEHGDCAGGVCLQYRWEGAPFCGAPCSGNQDCASGFDCVEVPEAGGQCAPHYEWCSARGGNRPFGENCWGHAMCESELCLVVPGESYCSRSCSADACPEGFLCARGADADAEESGVCLRLQSRGFGEACSSALECSGGLCRLGQCTQVCAAASECPEGARCVDGACVAPGVLDFGELCTLHNECVTALCEGRTTRRCALPCSVNSQCPEGSRCTVERRCTRSALQPEGELCGDDRPCLSALRCVEGQGGARCLRPCPGGSALECGVAEVCEEIGPEGGLPSEGEAADAGSLQVDAASADAAGPDTGGTDVAGEEPLFFCRPAPTSAVDSGATSAAPRDAKSTATPFDPGAGAIFLPSRGARAPSEGGCGTSGPGAWVPWILLALVRRRRPQPESLRSSPDSPPNSARARHDLREH